MTSMIDTLSSDAQGVLACLWAQPIMASTTLSYARPDKIHERTRKALTECVQSGYLTCTRNAKGVHYAAARDCSRYKSKRKLGQGIIITPKD